MNQYWVSYVRKRKVNEPNVLGWVLIEATNKGEARKIFLDNPPKDFDQLIARVVKM